MRGTNGVSFSLVPGAIILLETANAFNSGSSTSTTALTLNVNSTGAKQLTRMSFDDIIYQNSSALKGSARFILFMYTGSTYTMLLN